MGPYWQCCRSVNCQCIRLTLLTELVTDNNLEKLSDWVIQTSRIIESLNPDLNLLQI